MLKNDGKVIKLDIWPYYNDEIFDNANKNFDQFAKPKVITIDDTPYEFGLGNEYIIQSNSSDDFFYDPRQESRRIVGYFKIIGVSGPRQGYMSVIIKPVNIEMVELLKK